jgi:hypothetical protein
VYGAAWGAWIKRNVEREIRAGRLQQTLDDNGTPATIH